MAKQTQSANTRTLKLNKDAEKVHSVVFKGEDHSLYFRRDLFLGNVPEELTVTVSWK